jgi:hypothetical protein
MSDAEADAGEADVDDQGDEDLPEIEDDEFADADLDALAEEVEAEAGAPGDDAQEDDDTTEETADTTESADGETALGSTGSDGWGDMYVGTLTTVSNALIEEHGKPDADPVEEDLARQLHLDEHFDEWMAQRGKSEMPPEQAMLIGTTMFLVAVIGTKTEIPSKLLEEADF